MTVVARLERAGIRRLGTPSRGFRYAAAEGARVPRKDLARIRALKIPPAWKDVRIAPSPSARVLAVGKDVAGRWQYLYHPAQVARRERTKSERMVRFLRALPRMRRAVAADLRRPGIPREKVLAGVVTILSTCFFRPGSACYVRENGSYGVATIRPKHVAVRGDAVRFDFPGKSGKRQVGEIRDRRLARLVRELLKHPGEVFKFETAAGEIVDVRRSHINAYIREVMGDGFSAKDFRMWAANLLCVSRLARVPRLDDESEAARRRRVAAVVREVAGHLGHTPAVCRASYLFDSVIEGWEKGRIPAGIEPRAVARAERALARLLAARAA
jgi:DNA topoisomerase-1